MLVTALQDSSGPLKGRFAGRVRKPVSLAAMDHAIAQQASAWWWWWSCAGYCKACTE
jgi:hypothetical protein